MSSSQASTLPPRREPELARPELAAAVAYLEGRSGDPPRLGLVLGSGLGGFADALADSTRVPYAEIPNMPLPAVAGHAGNLCFGAVGGLRVACLQGRVHLYEGHSPDTVVFGVRLLAALGCGAVLLSNAAGGIAEWLAPGDLMLIVDHINCTGQNPLIGPNLGSGLRFPDMTHAYDLRLVDAARRASRQTGIGLREGVYAAMLGPSYETPAEVNMLRTLGAHAVGMSTVPEVIALRHAGVRVGAISCITNLAAGRSGALLDHREVETVAEAARERFSRLLGLWLELIATESNA